MPAYSVTYDRAMDPTPRKLRVYRTHDKHHTPGKPYYEPPEPTKAQLKILDKRAAEREQMRRDRHKIAAAWNALKASEEANKAG